MRNYTRVPRDHFKQTFLHCLHPHRATTHSTLAAGVVGGLLITVIVSLVIFVLLRRRRIRKKRTLRRLLQEREVGEGVKLFSNNEDKAVFVK